MILKEKKIFGSKGKLHKKISIFQENIVKNVWMDKKILKLYELEFSVYFVHYTLIYNEQNATPLK